MMTKLTVITEANGEIVATQIGHGEPDIKTGVVAGIVAGPGQTMHKTEFDVPRFRSEKDVEAFHRKLSDFLRK